MSGHGASSGGGDCGNASVHSWDGGLGKADYYSYRQESRPIVCSITHIWRPLPLLMRASFPTDYFSSLQDAFFTDVVDYARRFGFDAREGGSVCDIDASVPKKRFGERARERDNPDAERTLGNAIRQLGELVREHDNLGALTPVQAVEVLCGIQYYVWKNKSHISNSVRSEITSKAVAKVLWHTRERFSRNRDRMIYAARQLGDLPNNKQARGLVRGLIDIAVGNREITRKRARERKYTLGL